MSQPVTAIDPYPWWKYRCAGCGHSLVTHESFGAKPCINKARYGWFRIRWVACECGAYGTANNEAEVVSALDRSRKYEKKMLKEHNHDR